MLCSTEPRFQNSRNHPVNTRTLATLWFALPHWTGEKPNSGPIQPSHSNELLSVMMMWKWTMCHTWKPVILFLQIANKFDWWQHKSVPAAATAAGVLLLTASILCQASPCEPVQPFREHGTTTGPSFSRTFWSSRASVTRALCPMRRQTSLHPNISTRRFWQLCTQQRGTRMTQTLCMLSFSPSSSSPSESPNTSSSYLKISLWT